MRRSMPLRSSTTTRVTAPISIRGSRRALRRSTPSSITAAHASRPKRRIGAPRSSSRGRVPPGCRLPYSPGKPRGRAPVEEGRAVSVPLIVDHPAVQDRLARLRDASTSTPVFRRLVEELGQLLAYEATRELPQTEIELQTPVALAKVRRIATRPVVAPILRAGLGLLPGFMAVVDDAVVAHLGFYRDPITLAAIPYYANLPDDLDARDVFVLDPMLATGH